MRKEQRIGDELHATTHFGIELKDPNCFVDIFLLLKIEMTE